MRITHKRLNVDPDTFAPVLEIVVQFPIEYTVDPLLNENDVLNELAKEFILAIKEAPLSK